MEYVCSVDWKIVKDIVVVLIGACIPSGVAFWIFNQWGSQKAKEVLAAKAEDMYFEFDSLLDIHNKYENILKYEPETVTKDSSVYGELKSQIDKLLKKSKLFEDLLRKENSQYFGKFSEDYSRFKKFDVNAMTQKNLQKIPDLAKSLSSAVDTIQLHSEISIMVDLPNLTCNIKSLLTEIILHR